MKNLSVVVLTHNSETLLPRFLHSVSFVKPIIVIDDYSTDQTVAIAKEFGATVFRRKMDGYGEQKRFGLSKVTTQWVLLLDVDEIVSSGLVQEIQHVLDNNLKYHGFFIPYQNHFLGHSLQTLEQYAKIRLFQTKHGTVEKKIVHEEVVVKGSIGNLTNKLYHYSYRTLPQVLTKFTAYAHKEASIWQKEGRHVSWKRLTLYPLHMFWSIFIKDQGYKDGIWGFLLALCFSYYEFARYFFLWKKTRK